MKLVPIEPTPEMLRAWIVASTTPGADFDYQEPLVGTGQGDLQLVPHWVNVADWMKLALRYKAMIDAAPKG